MARKKKTEPTPLTIEADIIKAGEAEPFASVSVQYVARLRPEDLSRAASPAPPRSLIKSIKERGVLQPIFVCPDRQATGRAAYKVLAGLRRCLAVEIAREELNAEFTKLQYLTRKSEAVYKRFEEINALLANLETVPAILVAEDDTITLIENANRSRNPLHEYETIERMIRESGEEESAAISAIAKKTGMAVSAIRSRLHLRNLIKPLYTLLAAGKVSAGIATKAAKMSKAEQTRLAKIYRNTGKLRGDDCSQIRKVAVSEGERQFSFAELPMFANDFLPAEPLVEAAEAPTRVARKVSKGKRARSSA